MIQCLPLAHCKVTRRVTVAARTKRIVTASNKSSKYAYRRVEELLSAYKRMRKRAESCVSEQHSRHAQDVLGQTELLYIASRSHAFSRG